MLSAHESRLFLRLPVGSFHAHTIDVPAEVIHALRPVTPSGRLMFQIIGAMAEFERSLIQERVRAGLRNARAKGKKFGRPRAQVDPVRVATLRSEGLSWSQVCQRLKLSKGTAQRAFYSLPNHPQESIVVSA